MQTLRKVIDRNKRYAAMFIALIMVASALSAIQVYGYLEDYPEDAYNENYSENPGGYTGYEEANDTDCDEKGEAEEVECNDYKYQYEICGEGTEKEYDKENYDAEENECGEEECICEEYYYLEKPEYDVCEYCGYKYCYCTLPVQPGDIDSWIMGTIVFDFQDCFDGNNTQVRVVAFTGQYLADIAKP